MVLHRKTVSHTERDCYGCVCVIRHCLAVQADALRLLPMSLRSIGGKEPPFHGAFDCVFFFCSARWLQIHRTHVGMRMEVSVVICVLWFWVIWEWVGVNKEKNRDSKESRFFFVGVSGLEPEKAGPESAVLPLHHTPILLCFSQHCNCVSQLRVQRYGVFLKPPNFLRIFFEKHAIFFDIT